MRPVTSWGQNRSQNVSVVTGAVVVVVPASSSAPVVGADVAVSVGAATAPFALSGDRKKIAGTSVLPANTSTSAGLLDGRG